MNYFEESNKKAFKKLKGQIHSESIDYAKRVQEQIQVQKIVRNRKKEQKEYRNLRGTGEVPELINYTDVQISEAMQVGFEQNKESIRENLIIN